MQKNDYPSLSPFSQQAGKCASDQKRAGRLLEQFWRKAMENRRLLEQIWQDLATLYTLLRDWQQGRYRQLPWRTVLLSLSAMLYFINPLDLVPDFIPGIGYIDDMAILGIVFRAIQKDVLQYRQWKEKLRGG
jgi:uncharacterized membrane protein YkvA (DUF1232 family)